MKTKNIMKKLVFTLILLTVIVLTYGQTDPQKQLPSAMYEEEVNGDLEKAISLYEAIVRDHSSNRPVAAEALYRLGLSNEKLGNQKASSYYEDLINNYGDQSEKVKLAKTRLNALLALSPASEEGTVILKKLYSGDMYYGRASSTGRYFSFTDWGNDWNLYFVDIQTDETHQISNESSLKDPMAMVNFSVWSYGDKDVAYDFYNNGDHAIKIWNKDTGKTRTLMEESGIWLDPHEWTRDNKHLLISRNSPNLKERILELVNIETLESKSFNVDKGNPKEGGRSTFFVSISPDGDYILYHHTNNEDESLKLLSTTDGMVKTLENHSANEYGLKWEADGKGFVFISDRSGSPAIYRWGFENGNVKGEPEMIYQGIDNTFGLQGFGVDGSLLLSSRYTESNITERETVVGRSEFIHSRLIIDQAREFHNPRFSNDGTMIACILRGKSGDKLAIMDNDFNILKEVDFGFITESMSPHTWSFDDSKVMVLDQNGGNFINIVDLKTGTSSRHKIDGGGPVMLPDGNLIHRQFGKSGLILFNPESGEKEVIYSAADSKTCSSLRLSPDNKELAFTESDIQGGNNRSLKIMSLDNYEVETIYNSTEPERLVFENWLIDGKHLIITLNVSDEDGKSNNIQLFSLNIETGEKTPIGGKIDKENVEFLEINPQGTKVITQTRKSKTIFWKLIY